MRTSEEINEVSAALAQAQGVLRPAVKDAVNPAYKSKYADLAAVWEACAPSTAIRSRWSRTDLEWEHRRLHGDEG